MKLRFLYAVLLSSLIFGCTKPHLKPNVLTRFVNPFIGTDGPGNTYPGATVPFGMVQLSPDIGIGGWDRIAGYFYKDSIISGFSHLHLSGTGAGDLYDILVMPSNSKFSKRIKANGFRPFSKFSHQKESATAGYYSVDLLDFGIKAEVTATRRTGVHRYTFPKDDNSVITIDLGYALNWDAPTETQIKIVDKNTIEGFRKSTGWAKDQRVYFVMHFSKPFHNYELIVNNAVSKRDVVTGKNTKVKLQFPTSKGEQIIVKTGISTASIEGARKSLKKEALPFTFDEIKEKANRLWEHQLQKIKIETTDVDTKTIFYTMLYQSMLAPTLLSDVDGFYKGADGKVHQAKDFDRYDTFSLWDTYRTAHPLYTILHPERVSDFISSMLAHYQETGLLPVWSLQGNETNMMLGYHAVPVIVDAYFKGIKFDKKLAFEACKKSAMDSTRQIPAYIKYGFVPADKESAHWSVSKTLEYAFDDWCIAQFAKDLGKKEEYQYFLKRSENWKNLYDTKSKFFRPKYKNGVFVKDFIPKKYTEYFAESNAWQYFWSVNHDIEGLIAKVGGKVAFEKKLDSMFSLEPLPTDKLPIFSTGMIGQYAHGNEPSHHVGYLYNYVDKPWKTQKIIRRILETQYKNMPDGHCGNEDCGQMSSWYVMSSLGLYPVNPSQGIYTFGSPIFKKATLHLENGKQFVILTTNNSKENKYIKSIVLNGQKLDRNYITHQEILQGGEFVFTMSNLPNKEKLKIFLTSEI